MKVTYDKDAEAMYIYLTRIRPGGVSETQCFQRVDVDLDIAGQIAAVRLYESDSLRLHGRLRHALLSPQVSVNEASEYLQIVFVPTEKVSRTIPWDGNVDLDKEGQILGIEILFASTEDDTEIPSDLVELSRGVVRLRGYDKLRHIEKYLVSCEAAVEVDSA